MKQEISKYMFLYINYIYFLLIYFNISILKILDVLELFNFHFAGVLGFWGLTMKPSAIRPYQKFFLFGVLF